MDMLKVFVIAVLVIGVACLFAAPMLHDLAGWRWRFAFIPIELWFVAFIALVLLFYWIVAQTDFG